ncbi:biosynthetic peptidoglycan transglycosylase [Anaerosporobacter sp.]|uniref:biosynthetic peptidoglycan transglycosylase n=1 Tax=Anaerosporobacter sp. TaxID=1872529 RepID=UPI00289EA9A6|nr:biosynthetic peptidoglycan transglycosylase [Anaerosporobacter sp.]
MSKKRKLLYGVLGFCLVCMMAVGCLVTPIIIRGYDMYKAAVTEISIDEKVAEIQSDEDYLPLEQISDEYLTSLVKSEDKRFYKHSGIDYLATARAMINNVKARAFKEGGSTITQQLAKNMFFSFDKKLERKVAEVFVVRELEDKLTKDEILELYCNVIYFGENCYGIKEAANHYYGVEPNELTTSQIEALVYTIKSPNNYNPSANQVYATYNSKTTTFFLQNSTN